MEGQSKRVLVTGALGALGQAVLENLMKKNLNYQICATDRQASADNSIIQCDITDPAALKSCITQLKPDLILHLAASFSSDLHDAYQVNVEPTQHILDAVKSYDYNTRVVLIGSAAEYGVVQSSENPIKESRYLAPVSAYGVSKAWQTQLMSMYAACGVDVLCARIFNLYGHGVSERLFAGRLQKQIQDVVAGKCNTIQLGSLSATRDYISIDDAAQQLLVVAAYGVRGKVYHVASGIPVVLRDFVQQQLAIHGLDVSIVREDNAFSNHHGYDVPVIYADITMTKELEQYK